MARKIKAKRFRTISDTLLNSFGYKPRTKAKRRKRITPKYKIPATPKVSGRKWGG